MSPAGGGSGAAYRERLWAPVWLWLVASIIAGTLGLAFGVPLGLGAGIIAWALRCPGLAPDQGRALRPRRTAHRLSLIHI